MTCSSHAGQPHRPFTRHLSREPSVAAGPPSGESTGRSVWPTFLLVIAAGVGCRIALSLTTGYANDLYWFATWMHTASTEGLRALYDLPFMDYPPLYILLLRGLGGLLHALGFSTVDPAATYAWLRIPPCVADIAIAATLFIEARRLFGHAAGVTASVLYFLNPVSMYVSAYWGQVDSVHTCFVLASLVAVNRASPTWSGAMLALALLQKLQSVAFAPIILLDIYRSSRWKGLGRLGLGAAFAASLTLLPFGLTQTTQKVFERGYFHSVGAYPYRSMNAFNIWYLGGNAGALDSVPPRPLLEAASGGSTKVRDDQEWYLALTYRRISMILFVLLTASVLSIYVRTWSPASRALGAATLGLGFFLCLTEMHERYTFPVIGILPLWAAVGAWRERVYLGLSALILLNLTLSLSPEQIGGHIAVAFLLGLVALLAVPAVSPAFFRARAESTQPVASADSPPSPSRLVGLFQFLTVGAWIVCVANGALLVQRAVTARVVDETGVVYLSQLEPRVSEQGWGFLGRDQQAGNIGPLHVGKFYYLRGIGTHAPSTHVYDVPLGAREFQATVAIDRTANGYARCQVLCDGVLVLTSPDLAGGGEPFHLRVPVANVRQITLITDPLGSNHSDLVDWADAKFVR